MNAPAVGSRRTGTIEWGVAAQTQEGQVASGDIHVVELFPSGVLVGAVDGLGHGREATLAAELAAKTLAEHAGQPVIDLVRRCHAALTDTRGAVMSLASFQSAASTLSWTGVGNVAGVLLRVGPAASARRDGLLLRGGVVGFQLPPLFEDVLRVAPGDTLVLATDGVRPDFAEGLLPGPPAQALAERVLAQHLKGGDDALVLVAKFLGEAA